MLILAGLAEFKQRLCRSIWYKAAIKAVSLREVVFNNHAMNFAIIDIDGLTVIAAKSNLKFCSTANIIIELIFEEADLDANIDALDFKRRIFNDRTRPSFAGFVRSYVKDISQRLFYVADFTTFVRKTILLIFSDLN